MRLPEKTVAAAILRKAGTRKAGLTCVYCTSIAQSFMAILTDCHGFVFVMIEAFHKDSPELLYTLTNSGTQNKKGLLLSLISRFAIELNRRLGYSQLNR